jgi:hypothetical protein
MLKLLLVAGNSCWLLVAGCLLLVACCLLLVTCCLLLVNNVYFAVLFDGFESLRPYAFTPYIIPIQ